MNETKQNENKDLLNKNLVEVKLKRPIELDGVLLNLIKLDFSTMTGADLIKVDEELRLEGLMFDSIYNHQALLKLAAKAAKLIPDDLLKLHVADYMEVAFATRNFFLKW